MRLGTQTNSLTNHILSRMVIGQPEPEEGMGATILAWTERYPGTIIHVTKAHAQTVIYVRGDKATRTDNNGMSECQTYSFEPNPHGRLWTFRQAKNGTWEEVYVNQKTGRFNRAAGCGLRIGERDKYYDFSF